MCSPRDLKDSPEHSPMQPVYAFLIVQVSAAHVAIRNMSDLSLEFIATSLIASSFEVAKTMVSSENLKLHILEPPTDTSPTIR